jgi:hypothetical protein
LYFYSILKELHDRQAEQLVEREQKKKETKERRKKNLEGKKHTFHDKKYEQQKQKISEDLDTVLTQTLAKQTEKRKLETNTDAVESKISHIESDKTDKTNKNVGLNKMKGWLGVDDLDVSSSSDEDMSAETTSKKAKNS